MKILGLVLLLATASFLKAQNCTADFSVIFKDDVNNIQQGLSADDLKWMESKAAKKYPDVCYQPPMKYPPLVFYVVSSPSNCLGRSTVHTSGTITDPNSSDHADISTTYSVPTEVDCTHYLLSLERREAPQKYVVLHNFQLKGTERRISKRKKLMEAATLNPLALLDRERIPAHELIEQAMKWIHDGGLNDPMQTVIGEHR